MDLGLAPSTRLVVLALGGGSRLAAAPALCRYGFVVRLCSWSACQRKSWERAPRPDAVLAFVRDGSCVSQCGLVLQLRDLWPSVPMVLALGQDTADMLQFCTLVGAEDFASHSSSAAALTVRLRRAVERVRAGSTQKMLWADVEYDAIRHTLRADGRAVSLSPRECQLFHFLLSRVGRPVSVTEITQRAWGMAPDIPEAGNVVAVYVSSLRRKLARIGQGNRLRTVRRAGYALVAPVGD